MGGGGDGGVGGASESKAPSEYPRGGSAGSCSEGGSAGAKLEEGEEVVNPPADTGSAGVWTSVDEGDELAGEKTRNGMLTPIGEVEWAETTSISGAMKEEEVGAVGRQFSASPQALELPETGKLEA